MGAVQEIAHAMAIGASGGGARPCKELNLASDLLLAHRFAGPQRSFKACRQIEQCLVIACGLVPRFRSPARLLLAFIGPCPTFAEPTRAAYGPCVTVGKSITSDTSHRPTPAWVVEPFPFNPNYAQHPSSPTATAICCIGGLGLAVTSGTTSLRSANHPHGAYALKSLGSGWS